MNKISSILSIALLSGITAFTSCDVVDVPIPEPEAIDSTQIYPYIDSTALNDSLKMVMVEEFTGHKCSFCPGNTKLLLNLYEEHHNNMIIVSIHAGETFAKVDVAGGYPTDFNTPYGTETHDYYQIASYAYPAALVNRQTLDGLQVFASHAQWEDPILNSLDQPASLALGAAADYYEDENRINIRVSANALENISGEHKLIVVCVEDSVIAPQKDVNSELPNERVPDYAHRHVMRGKLNGGNMFGETIFNSIEAGEWAESLISSSLPSNIVNLNEVSIVAFVLDASNEEIIQSVEIHPTLLP